MLIVIYNFYLTYSLYDDIGIKSSGKRAGRRRPTLPAPGEGGRIMEFGMFVSWVVVGLLAGGLAEIVMKDGGYGLIGDLGLGIVGSVVGGGIFWALGVSTGGGLFPTVYVAFAGAVIVIVAQRQVWAQA
jgi:uncharacterized membrane protein YeaQ/YmgE (transglycosylase-associated protein family)